MPQAFPWSLLLTAPFAGCADTVNVGNAALAGSLAEYVTLSELVSGLRGAWYGTVEGPFVGASAVRVTFTPGEGRRDGDFTLRCRSGSCILTESVFGLLFTDPAPDEGTAHAFATGRFQLVRLIEDDSALWAQCVMTPYEAVAPAALTSDLSLGDDDEGELLRMKIADDLFDFRRSPE